MPDPDRKDFFISYNKADKTWAEWIAWELEAAGYSIIIQAWDFRPGSNFVLEMQKATTEARRTIAILSPDYLSAQFTQPEWASAFAQDPKGEKGILVPVRVKNCKPEGLVGPIIYIDLVGLDEVTARKTLISGLQERAKPSSTPGFPGKRPTREAPRFPGALPPIWNVPHARNPNFTGRDQLLQDLRDLLASGRVAALTALHGLGGVGKTQTALEYAYRFASDYDLIWWVRSEDPVTLASEYAALAGPLNLPEKDVAEQEMAVVAVCQALSRRGQWLLIFDNVGEHQDLKGYLPSGGGGHVLTTSRFSAWRGVAQSMDIKVLERPESVAFLVKRTGQKKEAAADELANELGDLPLALEQAGAYMDECGRSIGDYLELFRLRRQELLRRGHLSQDYPDTVATTWELSFQQVQAASPAAADLLNLCAFLAPDDIPKELLVRGAEHLPEPLASTVQDPLAFDDALATLRRYSLLEVSGNALAMHRLVQAMVRDRLDVKSKKNWSISAVTLLAAAFPGGDLQSKIIEWSWCSRLLPHALSAAGRAKTLSIILHNVGKLWNNMGVYLRIRGEFGEARRAFSEALTIFEKVHGKNDSYVANVENNLGSVVRVLGNLKEAQTHFERALAIWEQFYDSNNTNFATCVNNLGLVFRELGDLEGARSKFEQAMAVWKKIHGRSHPNLGRALNNLGSVLFELKEVKKAKECFHRALSIDEEVYGPNHPEVAITLNNLGKIFHDLGNLQMAKQYFERTIAIDETAYGTNHPEIATEVSNLAHICQDLGDLPGAKAHYERALAIYRQFLGEDHPKTKTVKRNLATLSSPKD